MWYFDTHCRFYEEQQQAKFAALESKARREKNALLNLVLAAQDGELGEALSAMSLHSPISPLGNERQTGEYSQPQPQPQIGSIWFN